MISSSVSIADSEIEIKATYEFMKQRDAIVSVLVYSIFPSMQHCVINLRFFGGFFEQFHVWKKLLSSDGDM